MNVFSFGLHNAITAAGVFTDVPTTVTFVPVGTTKSQLDDLITDMEPGDFAATFGLGSVWQWDGTEWRVVV